MNTNPSRNQNLQGISPSKKGGGSMRNHVISPCQTCKYRWICFFFPFLELFCPRKRGGKVY